MPDPATDNPIDEQPSAPPPDSQSASPISGSISEGQVTNGGNAPATGSPSAPSAPARTSQTFGGGFKRGVAGTPYKADPTTGDISSADNTKPSFKGVMGSILAGALMGALHGASAPRGSGFQGGVKASLDAAQQQDQQNRASAQQNFNNEGTAQKRQQENTAAADEHTLKQVQSNHESMETYKLINEDRRAEAEFPIKLQESQTNLRKSQLDNLSTIFEGADIDPSDIQHITSYGQMTPELTKSVIKGELVPVANGESGDKRGAALVPATYFDRVFAHPVTLVTGHDLDPNTHQLTDVKKEYPAGTTVEQAYLIAQKAQKQGQDLLSKRDQQIKGQESADKHQEVLDKHSEVQPGIDLKKAEATKDYAEAAKAKVEKLDAQQKLLADAHPELSGEDYLKTLPPGNQALIRQIKTGHLPPEKLTYALVRNQAFMEQLSRAAPEFKGDKLSAYIDAQKNFTTGKQGQMLTAANGGFQHLLNYYNANKHLGSEIGVLGGAANAERNAALGDAATELARLNAGTGAAPSKEDIKNFKDELNPQGGFGFVGAATRSKAVDMVDKLYALQRAYNDTRPNEFYPSEMPQLNPVVLKQAFAIIHNDGIIPKDDRPYELYVTPEGRADIRPKPAQSESQANKPNQTPAQGQVPSGGQPILRNGQPVGYILNGQRVNF